MLMMPSNNNETLEQESQKEKNQRVTKRGWIREKERERGERSKETERARGING